MAKKEKTDPETNEEKNRFDTWGWRLAWLGFAALFLSNVYKLLKSMDTPKKDDYSK